MLLTIAPDGEYRSYEIYPDDIFIKPEKYIYIMMCTENKIYQTREKYNNQTRLCISTQQLQPTKSRTTFCFFTSQQVAFSSSFLFTTGLLLFVSLPHNRWLFLFFFISQQVFLLIFFFSFHNRGFLLFFFFFSSLPHNRCFFLFFFSLHKRFVFSFSSSFLFTPVGAAASNILENCVPGLFSTVVGVTMLLRPLHRQTMPSFDLLALYVMMLVEHKSFLHFHATG